MTVVRYVNFVLLVIYEKVECLYKIELSRTLPNTRMPIFIIPLLLARYYGKVMFSVVSGCLQGIPIHMTTTHRYYIDTTPTDLLKIVHMGTPLDLFKLVHISVPPGSDPCPYLHGNPSAPQYTSQPPTWGHCIPETCSLT